jgi:hypothetical protein
VRQRGPGALRRRARAFALKQVNVHQQQLVVQTLHLRQQAAARAIRGSARAAGSETRNGAAP